MMAEAREWAALAREWLRASSPRAAQALREHDQEAARRRRERRPAPRRGRPVDQEAAREPARWAVEPEAADGPGQEEIERARAALTRATSLERARARARRERGHG
ncbi:hypothetical protein AB0J71_07630 [Nonomuraea sp. NPDC049637]|uniref:hypothetical protein n=1 Tax=Nonomuraea sp. NPDC049637 TaxID=3154356 RepID=UPI0034319C18